MKIPNYIFPPRAEVKISSNELSKYDDGTYFAQPKYNGACCVVFIEKGGYIAYNRHKELISKFECNILPIHRGTGTMVLAGEYLNKSQLGEQGQDINKVMIYEFNPHIKE